MKMIDLTNQVFGKLLATSIVSRGGKNIKWACRCECGNSSTVSTTHLRSGHTTSCGCVAEQKTAQRNRESAKHGKWQTVEYDVWHAIIQRCTNPKNKKYKDYGGRDIKIADEWRHSFENFIAHVGKRPGVGFSIDRIDNSRGYEPGNVRWASLSEQNNNRRSNVKITVDGRELTAAQVAKEYGLLHNTVLYRIQAGWPPHRVIEPSRRAHKAGGN